MTTNHRIQSVSRAVIAWVRATWAGATRPRCSIDGCRARVTTEERHPLHGMRLCEGHYEQLFALWLDARLPWDAEAAGLVYATEQYLQAVARLTT